ncbi:MAG: methyl-accepting chemotaxis protein [Desulfobacterales bacterium]|nr:methyl-accepting chemotaxis protein [Desulfobacterales bacterium]
MNWNDLTIGKKITAGFGIVIILLVILGGLSFTGVGGIVKNASEVIDGKALDGELAQKEVDHLNWIGEVNALLTDEAVTTLNVQTDHTQCGFGQWLYGPGRQQAEALVPSLAPILKEIEEPHRLLHESAIAIDKAYAPADPGLPGFIANKLGDHLEWSAVIQKAILDNVAAIEVETDHTRCGFGKWLYGEAAAKAAASDSKIAGLLEQIKAPHERLHSSAKNISDTYRQIHVGLRNTLRLRLDDHRRWAGRVSRGIIEETRLKVETNPEQCGFGKWLASGQVKALTAQNPTFREILNRVKPPHNALHTSAIHIDEAIAAGDLDRAKHIFQTQTEKHLAEVSDLFEQAIAYEDSLVAGRNQAIHLFKTRSLPELTTTKQLLAELQQRAQALLQGQRNAASIYAVQTAPNLQTVQTLLNTLRDEVKRNMLTDKAMLKAASSTRRNVAITAGIAILSGVFLSFIIARGIIRILTRITDGMGEGANQVASAAGQVSNASQSMAEGASQQAASIEETSSSMEEMASMTKKNAENASHADGLMKEANQVVVKANRSMGSLTRSMADITQASEETSKIIKTIDEIAFQTNLLALNAAVEAARAGEAGAGFAVEADEVRNLAMRAAEAAKDTAQLIEGTVQKVNEGSELVASTNEDFVRVAESSDKVGELITEISEASGEQSNGIDQVNIAISEMDKVVQQNAANAEESASAAEEMNAQAEQLRDYVNDLVIMVKGKGSGTTLGTIGAADSSGHLSAPTLSGRDRKHLAGSPHAREVKPEQVIPFEDDDDFKDF